MDKAELVYSTNPKDLGNISDFEELLKSLSSPSLGLKPHLKPKTYLTTIERNKKGGAR